MPNFVGNDICFMGPRSTIVEIRDLLLGEFVDFDFNRVIDVDGLDFDEGLREQHRVAELLYRDPAFLSNAGMIGTILRNPNQLMRMGVAMDEIPSLFESTVNRVREAVQRDPATLADVDSNHREEVASEVNSALSALATLGLVPPANPREAAEILWGARPAFSLDEPDCFQVSETLSGENSLLRYYLQTAWEEPGVLIEEIASRFPEVEVLLICDYEGEDRVRIVSMKGDQRTVEFDDAYRAEDVAAICARFGIKPVAELEPESAD